MSKRAAKRLYRRGLNGKGLLPLNRKREITDMVAMLKGPVFRDVMVSLRAKRDERAQTRNELIKLIEEYIRHPEIISPEFDLLLRAKVEGSLLESVLMLLIRDRLDPVGCIILAQQEDRESQVGQVPSLLEIDLD